MCNDGLKSSFLFVSMPNLTLRDVDRATLSRIQATARTRKISVNQLILETLRTHFAARSSAPDGLDSMAGSWTAEEAAEFNAAIARFGEIDSKLWQPSVPPRNG